MTTNEIYLFCISFVCGLIWSICISYQVEIRKFITIILASKGSFPHDAKSICKYLILFGATGFAGGMIGSLITHHFFLN